MRLPLARGPADCEHADVVELRLAGQRGNQLSAQVFERPAAGPRPEVVTDPADAVLDVITPPLDQPVRVSSTGRP
jgi:hypothetical protein